MRKVGTIFVFILLISAYRFANKEKQNVSSTTNNEVVSVEQVSVNVSKADEVIEIADSYKGVGYKFGGTDNNGMDCSGLVYTSFKKIGIQLPRTSKAMSAKGSKIDLNNVQRGDLIFFNIDRLQGNINHVGLVVDTDNYNVVFIHSSTSKGVTVSSLEEDYWKDAFVVVKRVL
ncbi:C40 family peptidase [Tenacibaculum sp. M341]|uniref:C40 family peptidase n=1 Tax=Tenacibaculum sp. M341 TaxID=2530339 RepID=UPI00105189E6|nr:C40 family peptidase [Tenacibaculum sp. M341]TCI85212.1 NlpC/P60 family protein [Tenacibaculum sp. M341]